jgi:hypothetical protein
LILPVSHYLINHCNNLSIVKLNHIRPYATVFIAAVAFFAFCATSIAPRKEMPQGTIYIGESYNIKLPKDSIINTIKKLGYNCEYYTDSIVNNYSNFILLFRQEGIIKQIISFVIAIVILFFVIRLQILNTN